MRCPECHYELTDNEKLLCLIPGGHYCPQCWSRIAPEPAPGQGGTDPKGRRRNDPTETPK